MSGEHTHSKGGHFHVDAAPLALPGWMDASVLWRPRYLAPSAWSEHVPFAFWLTNAQRPRTFVELGTHYGTSYFAFCQAVAELGLDTRCFAVDTWQGDEHAGHYGEEVYGRVQAHNDEQYSAFSRLVRSTFDQALEHFSDGTIDLLHIDGLHTFDAVRHDFRSWLPKLSDRAVVVMHDINVRERSFGVFRLFEELSRDYPAFDFAHGHGLGVLGVGANQTAALRRLFEAGLDAPRKREAREIFSHLGRACADSSAAGGLAEARLQLERMREQYAVERGLLVERLASERELLTGRMESERALLEERLAAGQDLVSRAAQAESAARSEHRRVCERMAAMSEEHRHAAVAMAEQLRLRERELDAVRAEAGERYRRYANQVRALGQALERSEAQGTALASKAAALEGELEAGSKRLRSAEHELQACRVQVESIHGSRFWRLTSPVRRMLHPLRWWRARRDGGMAARRAREVHLVRQSGLFDDAWYLDRYADVARAGCDPVEHYLASGAAEGRDPSPSFSTGDYLDRHPDVAASGLNPLVHSIRNAPGGCPGRDGTGPVAEHRKEP